MASRRVLWPPLLIVLLVSGISSLVIGKPAVQGDLSPPYASAPADSNDSPHSIVARRVPRNAGHRATSLAPERLAIEQTPEGPIISGFIWSHWPIEGGVCSGHTGSCPFGSQVGQTCSIGDSEPVQPCGRCTTYDCAGPNQKNCCYTCIWKSGSQCPSGCATATNCGHI